MKMNYEAPVAEVISFTSMEQLASLNLDLNLDGTPGVGSRDF
jgi:hypothetical protein